MSSPDESRWGKQPSQSIMTQALDTYNLPLAQAYIPIQAYGKTFTAKEALDKGTLFIALYRPCPR